MSSRAASARYDVACPSCGAEPNQPCRALSSGRVSDSHAARRQAWADARQRPRWVDMFGIDPDYCDGKPVDEWLDENRGEA